MEDATLLSDAFWSLWWVWACGALVLGLIEMLLPGFIALGFAIGAGLVALILLVSGVSLGLPVLLVVFSVLSLIAWLTLRRIFALPRGQVKRFTHDIND